MSIYKSTKSNVNFAEIDLKINKYWQENNLFQKSIDLRKEQKSDNFVFFDGPPFANGLPHYGHLLTGYVKDIVARYQTMQGKIVERRFGWDCHGLPAEMGAEKELNISGRMQIMDYGIDKFNDHCRISVLKYSTNWQEYVSKQGRWVDFENDYKTMNIDYMESVIWGFKQLFNKGLIYQSMRVMPYSWACETPLSNFETRLDNSYRERADKAATVKFKLQDTPNSFLLAWTTTPWTLPSNLALAIGEDIDYVSIEKDGENLILAKSSVRSYAKELEFELDKLDELPTMKGAELVGLKYEPVFNYFQNHENAFVVLAADFVEEGDGTAIVHIAPGFGEDDQILCQKHGIELVCPVDNAGKFTSEVPDFQGKMVLETNDEIIKELKQKNLWLKTEQYLHNYPHCWRTDTPLIYKAVPSWYVEVTKFKDRMVELNEQINWIPAHVKHGSFGKWLENARDWSISRNRFWGTPIPVWQSDDPQYPRIDVYGSIAELEKDFGVEVKDLHRPFIDELTRPNPNDPTGKSTMKRVADVFDCWFESGSMPFAQNHYPFENVEFFEKNFPADFIVEYSAQTRGWFYTLMVLGTAIFDKPPFLNCICHGVILDENGSKLSKRLQNYADPLDIFKSEGSDALRFLMCSSSVMRGQELLIDKEGKMIRDISRLSLKPIWNAYNFFTLYANSDNLRAEINFESKNLLDQYIISKCQKTISKIATSLDSLNIADAYGQLDDFFEILNNWYIRRNRQRFWSPEKNDDKISAYNTLYSVLITVIKAAAPLVPFLAEEIYLGLEGGKESVHLEDFPKMSQDLANETLENQMDAIREICSHLLAIRSQENIRVRQPLASAKVIFIDEQSRNLSVFSEIIKDEVNVKNVDFTTGIKGEANFKLKINFKDLGKRLPEKMKEIIAASKQGKWQRNSENELEVAGIKLENAEYEVILEPEQNAQIDNEKVHVLPSGLGLVKLNIEIDENLKNEGLARDLVRHLQQSRKNANFDITDRIKVQISANQNLLASFENFENFIKEQVLANEIHFSQNALQDFEQLELDGENVQLKVERD